MRFIYLAGAIFGAMVLAYIVMVLYLERLAEALLQKYFDQKRKFVGSLIDEDENSTTRGE